MNNTLSHYICFDWNSDASFCYFFFIYHYAPFEQHIMPFDVFIFLFFFFVVVLVFQ